MKGIVKFFNPDKGWGFITVDNGEDLFVHYSSIIGRDFKTLEAGERVSFDEGENEKGKTAINVLVQE